MNADEPDVQIDPQGVWEAALAELKHQMTKATFNSWLAPTRALPGENGALVVGVPTQFALEWLDNRLRKTVERTVAGLVGEPVEVRFVVVEEPALVPLDVARGGPLDEGGDGDEEWTGFGALPDWAQALIGDLTRERDGLLERLERLEGPAQVASNVTLRGCETKKAGFVPMPGYCQRFWAPLLRRVAWRVWELVLREDRRRKKDEWTPARKFSAPKLADLAPCGVQALTGTWRQCDPEHPLATEHPDVPDHWRRWQRGAFDRLQEEGLARVEAQGGWRHRTYLISVRTTWPAFPLLSPAQASRLREDLQEQHETWLESHGFDPREWDVR